MYGFYLLGEALYELMHKDKNKDKKGTYIAYNKETKEYMIKDESNEN